MTGKGKHAAAYAIAIRNKQAVIGRLPFWALSTFYGTGGVSSKVPI